MKHARTILAAVVALASTSLSTQPDRVTLPYGQKIFVSGINVAWKSFAGDVGNTAIDTAWFSTMLQGVADSGGNAVRWWLFTNCSNAPTFDASTKLVNGLGTATVSNVRKVLDMAYARGISVDLCLLSFDMMKTNQGADTAANKKILQTDAGRKAFLDNAVVPLVAAIGRHPAVLDWEIFNEPEGMVIPLVGNWGNMDSGIAIPDIQKMVNQAAGAIHRAVPGVLVSDGSWAFIASSNTISGDHDYYSDSALKAAGGDADGTLDFLMVHYYEWAGKTHSPFHHPASYWGLSKPLVIGEFPAKGLSDSLGPMTPADCWKYLYDNGYAGAMGWTYTAHDGFGGLPEAGQGMRALKTLDSQGVTLDFPPTAADDWYSDNAGRTISIAAPGVLSNDLDPTVGQKLSASLLSGTSHGTVSLAADGSFSYTPATGWWGSDSFAYVATSGGASDTAKVVLRVLDASKGRFFAPPQASDWNTYVSWGTATVSDVSTGLAFTNQAWGSPWQWLVGTKVPVTVTAAEQTISVWLHNDPASPWSVASFHLADSAKVSASYGPTDTTSNMVALSARTDLTADFVEYSGVLTPSAAGRYLPSLDFVWHCTTANDGSSTALQSIVRDLEIIPSSEFASTSLRAETDAASSWNLAGNVLSIQAEGLPIELEAMDVLGREVAHLASKDALRWPLPLHSGLLLVRLRTGASITSFALPTIGR